MPSLSVSATTTTSSSSSLGKNMRKRNTSPKGSFPSSEDEHHEPRPSGGGRRQFFRTLFQNSKPIKKDEIATNNEGTMDLSDLPSTRFQRVVKYMQYNKRYYCLPSAATTDMESCVDEGDFVPVESLADHHVRQTRLSSTSMSCFYRKFYGGSFKRSKPQTVQTENEFSLSGSSCSSSVQDFALQAKWERPTGTTFPTQAPTVVPTQAPKREVHPDEVPQLDSVNHEPDPCTFKDSDSVEEEAPCAAAENPEPIGLDLHPSFENKSDSGEEEKAPPPPEEMLDVVEPELDPSHVVESESLDEDECEL